MSLYPHVIYTFGRTHVIYMKTLMWEVQWRIIFLPILYYTKGFKRKHIYNVRGLHMTNSDTQSNILKILHEIFNPTIRKQMFSTLQTICCTSLNFLYVNLKWAEKCSSFRNVVHYSEITRKIKLETLHPARVPQW